MISTYDYIHPTYTNVCRVFLCSFLWGVPTNSLPIKAIRFAHQKLFPPFIPSTNLSPIESSNTHLLEFLLLQSLNPFTFERNRLTELIYNSHRSRKGHRKTLVHTVLGLHTYSYIYLGKPFSRRYLLQYSTPSISLT